MKKSIAFVLCLFLLLPVFASCGSGDDKGPTISVYLGEYPISLDPAAVQYSADATQILNLIYETLTIVDEKGNVKPGLATKWEAYYDNREDTYNMYFYLRDTAWNDKRKVTADDIVSSWIRILLPETESPYASLLFPLKNAKNVKSGIMTQDDLGLAALSNDILKVTFETDYDIQLFAETVSCIHLAPVRTDVIDRTESFYSKDDTEPKSDKEFRDRDWSSNAASLVTNGPFKVKNLEEGEKIILERNPYYRRVDDDKLTKYVTPQSIVVIFQESGLSSPPDTVMSQIEYQMQRYRDENIFYVSGLDKETYNQNLKNVKSSETMDSYVFYFNNANSILSDARTRSALSISLDRSYIANDLLGGTVTAATGYVPSGVFNTSRKDDFREVGGNLYSSGAETDKAKSLLKESGAKGEFELSYLVPQGRDLLINFGKRANYENTFEQIATYAKETWEALGFKVTLRPLYYRDYIVALYERDYDVIGVVNAVGSVDAFAYLAPFAKEFSGTAVSIDFYKENFSLHYTNFNSSEYEDIINSMYLVSDRTVRAEKLHQAEELLIELCPATALFVYKNNYLPSKAVSKITTDYFGNNIFTKMKLKNYKEINAREQEESDKAATTTSN